MTEDKTNMPEMAETSDLPNDGSLKEAYEQIAHSENAEQVIVGENTADYQSAAPLKVACHECGQKLDLSTLPPFSLVVCPVCGAEVTVPKWFDSYLLEEVCGTGGMATVYRALDMALDREVAIKVLNDDFSSEQERSEMFLQEARTAATINHHAVIPIYTCGIFEDQTYIVMQYMNGGSLEDLLKTAAEPLPLVNVVSWIRDAASGLENASQYGIVHHDIKPANIMLDQDGKAKIGDFGIAQAANRDATATSAQSWVSPHYVSPEKLLNGTEDSKGDIYSLGATFYHLVTGVPPFESDDLDELLRMRINEAPASPAIHRAGLPENMVQLILAMLARNPEDRPDYGTIIRTLTALLNRMNGNGGGSSAPKKRQPAAAARRTASPRSASSHSPLKQKKKTPASLVMLKLFSQLFSLLVLLGGTIFLLDKYNRLNAFVEYLPEFMQANKKPLAAEKRLNTELVYSFQSGDPENVVRNGEEVIRREQHSKRFQAALQVSYAAYLVNSSEKPVQDYISRGVASLQVNMTPLQKIVFEDTLVLLRYLSGELSYEDLDSAVKFTKAHDYNAKLALAEMLTRIQSEPAMNEKTRLELLNNFEAELDSIAAEACWLRDAFADRLPYWKQVFSTGTGIIDEIEPLFRPLIREEAKWTFTEPKKLRRKTADLKDFSEDAADVPGGSSIIITAMRVNDGQKKFENLERPQHKTPFDFFDSKERMTRYIQGLSADKEVIRIEVIILNRIKTIPQHMVLATEEQNGGGLPVDAFTWTKKCGTLELGAGKIVFTERNIQYIPEGGKETDAVYLSWLDFPADLLKIWLEKLAERRCAKPHADPKAVGTVGVRKDQLERAELWLDLAYIASWYDDRTLLEKALKAAAAETAYPEAEQQITGIFLRVIEQKEE